MVLKISKRYHTYSFHPISAKLGMHEARGMRTLATMGEYRLIFFLAKF